MGYSKVGRYPPARSGWGGYTKVGVPPLTKVGTPPTSTCHMTGSMPLVFTQEDFLVVSCHVIKDCSNFQSLSGCFFAVCVAPLRTHE